MLINLGRDFYQGGVAFIGAVAIVASMLFDAIYSIWPIRRIRELCYLLLLYKLLVFHCSRNKV